MHSSSLYPGQVPAQYLASPILEACVALLAVLLVCWVKGHAEELDSIKGCVLPCYILGLVAYGSWIFFLVNLGVKGGFTGVGGGTLSAGLVIGGVLSILMQFLLATALILLGTIITKEVKKGGGDVTMNHAGNQA